MAYLRHLNFYSFTDWFQPVAGFNNSDENQQSNLSIEIAHTNAQIKR